MNIKLLCLPLLLGCFTLQAEIYKSTDADGNVSFSDAPSATTESEPVEIQTPNTIAPTSAPALTPQGEIKPDFRYTSLSISPANDSTIRSNNGNFSVTLTLTPALKTGHSLHFYFDGKKQAGSGTSYQFNNVDRGAHNLRAEVVDGDGKVLIQQSSTVHLQRATAQLNTPTPSDDDEISILPIFDEMVSALPWVGDDTPSVGTQPVWPKDRLAHYEDANGNESVSMLQPTAPTWPQDRLR